MNLSRENRNEVLRSVDDRTLIMGIVNVTPDSFSDGGEFDEVEAAVKHARELVDAGADIIDIGGESTRPNAIKVEQEEELRRVLPKIKAIAEVVNVPISIDTYKAEVAKQAIEAGATIINDVWGAKWDKEMAGVASAYQVPIILMHNRKEAVYTNLIQDMITDLNESIAICTEAGVKHENIILDPGIGFAKSHEENLEVMRNLDVFVNVGYPVLLGTSRKSIIAKTLNLPVGERVEGTGATVCYGIMKGCQIMRVHDVLEISRMAKMMDALMMKGASGNG
ncbi:dihydropteroate synthase [Halalkalibacter nanhaiisediminis]|uniref:Dihydropteroate synthase n=1 Tax=Halalkalibacter nanhaiisediminis TaxID=688079 RepID=A0A562Q8X4_9BACI|nr:dihydropteroate synthase [Halalkalibacter nanhaiisediminis]TWI53202.1 Dihydropteroate synthase [Halalkalibacter nanhaiisediminis]